MEFELKQSLYKPLPPPGAESQRLITARVNISEGNGTPEDIRIAQANQYASEAEKAAATGGPTPAPAARTPAPTAPRETSRASTGPVTLRDSALKTTYDEVNARFATGERFLRGRATADAAKGDEAALNPQQHQRLIARNEELRAQLGRRFTQFDERLATASTPAERTRVMAEVTALSTQLDQQLDSLERAQTQRDPFDADAFFNRIEPMLRTSSETAGRMVRAGGNALVDGGAAIVDAVTHPGRTAEGAGDAIGDAFNRARTNINGGTIGGAVAGGAIGMLIASIFGPGPLKIGLMVLLVPAMMFLGATQFAGPINNFFSSFGRGRSREGNASAPERTQETAQAAAPQQETPAPGPLQAPVVANGAAPWTMPFEMLPLNAVPREDLRGVNGVYAAMPPSVAQRVHYVPHGRNDAQDLYEEGRRQTSAHGSQRITARERFNYDDGDVRVDVRQRTDIRITPSDEPRRGWTHRSY